MKAIVLDRNKLVNRRIARIWSCAGLDVVGLDDPAELPKHVDGATLLGADAFDGATVLHLLKGLPHLRAVLWTAEPMDRVIRFAAEEPRLSNLLGRADFESTPRPSELVMVARRLTRPEDGIPGFSSYLSWGFTGFQDEVRGTADRDASVGHVQKFVERIGVPRRVAEMYGELAHELLMNAVYDAPADASGKAKYAANRKATVALEPSETATLKLASDGMRLVIQVVDPFGRLERKHVFAGLARGLKGGEMDTSHGGAGLGMLVCHNSTVAMYYDVMKGKQTSAIGVFDLDMNLREFRTQAKSLHYFEV